MNFLMKSKTFIILFSLLFLVIVTGTVTDLYIKSDNFMQDGGIKSSRRLDEIFVREVASGKQFNFIKNDRRGRGVINGLWKITKMTNSFDKREDSDPGILKFKLEDDDIIRVIGMNGNSFLCDITYLDVKNKIIKMKHSYTDINSSDSDKQIFIIEFFEAVKMKRKTFENNVSDKISGIEALKTHREIENTVTYIPGVMMNDFHDLRLASSQNMKTKKSEVYSTGELVIESGRIITLIINTESGDYEFDTDDIMGGGIFRVSWNGEEFQARVNNDGAMNKFRIKFFGGPLQGEIFHFNSPDAVEAIKNSAIESMEIAEQMRTKQKQKQKQQSSADEHNAQDERINKMMEAAEERALDEDDLVHNVEEDLAMRMDGTHVVYNF